MNNAIETSDIFRGAYLLCCGGYINATRLSRGQVWFVIEGDGVLEEDLRYRMGTALVNPVQLRETLNLLRDHVFERLRKEKRSSRHESHPRGNHRADQTHHGSGHGY